MTLLSVPARQIGLPYCYQTITGLSITVSLIQILQVVAPDVGSFEASGSELRTLRPLDADTLDLLRLVPAQHGDPMRDLAQPLPVALSSLPDGARYLGAFNTGTAFAAHVVALRDGSLWAWRLALGTWRLIGQPRTVRGRVAQTATVLDT